jgi:O-acetyl-ADP-ribose deacetylase (regulator of RNase III)/transcriptional regulator with XRE-family HTH domain
VNPTNAKMFGRGGVDGAIHKAEGIGLLEETSKMGELAPGQCVWTKAYKLPAKNIIHTVGPTWDEKSVGQEEILRNCYKNSLELAKEKGFDSLAFPLISSGSYGCPKNIALNIAVRTIGEFLLFNEMTVYLVVFDKKAYQVSEELYASVEAYIDDHYIDETYIDKMYSSTYLSDNPSIQRSRRMEEHDYFPIEEAISETFSKESLHYSKLEKKSLDDVIHHLDESFPQMLLRLIDERGLKDPQVYKKANVTKQTFSKIRNKSSYNPTKQTVLAFAVALELSLDEAKDLLLKAGYALSKSNRFDVIMSYFFETENYDIYVINEVLFEYDESLLGV